MRIEEISNVEALGGAATIAALALALYLAVPGERRPPRKRRHFREDEVTAYDGALPKYFVAALVALTVAGVHTVVKALPPAHAWLADAGHGGHLVRDIANTHLMIVVGGTVAATGLTWYVLPRVLQTPLANQNLAGASFWCTVVGAGGFYVTNVVVGLVAGTMAHDGVSWHDAEAAMGVWKALPVGLSATVMGIGYWTFVAEVLLTVRAARWTANDRPDRHLAKFFVVGALGLFVGTVQGVIQVMPAQEDWLHATAPAGEYIDPIAHAHVNLVTGSLVLLAGIAFWWTRQPARRLAQRAREQRVFWVLVPGSILFYVTFMTLGFVEGRLILADGLTFEEAVDRLGPLHIVPLAATGTITLVGLWSLAGVLLHRLVPAARHSAPAGMVVAAMAALVLGTSQGFVQVVPAAKRWLEAAGQHGDAVANAHAQLNMLGGVMLALVALVLGGSAQLVGRPAPSGLADRVLRRSAPGVAVYYLGAMVTAVAGARADAASARPAVALVPDVAGPLLMATGAAVYTAGFGAAAVWVWRATADGRQRGWRRVRASASAYDGGRAPWVGHVPWPAFVAAEAAGAAAGFPGWGWIISGRAAVGLPCALIGPSVAWGVIPAVMAGDGVGPVGAFPVAYLVVTAAVSAGSLALALGLSTKRMLSAEAVS